VTPPPAAATEHAVAINNADVSADYAAKLRHELEGMAERVFPGVGEHRDRWGCRLPQQQLPRSVGVLLSGVP
jgi:hypothetical protein